MTDTTAQMPQPPLQPTQPQQPQPAPSPPPSSTALSDISALLTTVQNTTATQWSSPSFIEGVLVKLFALLAIYHPNLHVGQWEPLIAVLSVGVVAAESVVHRYMHQKKVSEALVAAQTVIRQKGNFGAA